MEQIKKELKMEAEKKHGKILPMPGKNRIEDGITTPMAGTIALWFMLENGSSGCVYRKLEQ